MSLDKSNNFNEGESDRFVYLVTYTTSGVVGRGFIDFAEEMDSPEKVIHCEKSLMKSLNAKELIITNFQLLKKEPKKESIKSDFNNETELTYDTLKSALDDSDILSPYKSNLHCLIMGLKNIVNRASFKVNLNEIIITNKYITIEMRVLGPKDRPTYVIPGGLEYYAIGFDAIVDLRVNGITSTELQPSMLKNMAIVSNLDLRVSGLTKNK